MTIPVPTRRRPRLGWLVAAAVVLVVALGVLAWSLVRPGRDKTAVPQDVSVQVTDVVYEQRSREVTVTSVEAFTRGDDGFVRLHLRWSANPDPSSDVRSLPSFAVEVLHREPYAGATAACGLPATTTVPADAPPATVELPCSGLLVPADVARVSVRD